MTSPLTDSPYWQPEVLWPGETVFIIGGGPSLKNMDWAPFRSQRVIGLNDAYRLGDWMGVCFWGDNRWWDVHCSELKSYRGMKISAQTGKPEGDPEVKWVHRWPDGLSVQNRIGWNWSTGAAAINLALVMGARKVVLLGYDMKPGPKGERNWHDNNIDSIPLDYKEKPDMPSTLERQQEGFWTIARALPSVFPGAQVLNAGPDSVLQGFPMVNLEDVL